jgi:hypothetical protein
VRDDAARLAEFTAARQAMLRAWQAMLPRYSPKVAALEAAATARAMTQIAQLVHEPGGAAEPD